MSTAGTTFAEIEVAGIGMRLTLNMDCGGWTVAGWSRRRGTLHRQMTVFGSASAGRAPHFTDEDEGGPGMQVGSTYVGLPPASLRRLKAFVAPLIAPKPERVVA
ncbi:hypothetical protein LQE85_08610 [Stenotrophomonas rhizophila]|uniref:hypothetical protein n=1 Tax=Stenotrophomonas rhizophila TaxID=216778 RepID=UPI00201D1B97|nr:hypothetical protein [Stenotrophomonas rhizophila]UQY89242.1 hypothetical protein LQE85_08610 [Stenotrophomonas rhizophila]